jgi:hypothetical protein
MYSQCIKYFVTTQPYKDKCKILILKDIINIQKVLNGHSRAGGNLELRMNTGFPHSRE